MYGVLDPIEVTTGGAIKLHGWAWDQAATMAGMAPINVSIEVDGVFCMLDLGLIWTMSPALPGRQMHRLTHGAWRRVVRSSSCPCPAHADWWLESDAVPDSAAIGLADVLRPDIVKSWDAGSAPNSAHGFEILVVLPRAAGPHRSTKRTITAFATPSDGGPKVVLGESPRCICGSVPCPCSGVGNAGAAGPHELQS